MSEIKREVRPKIDSVTAFDNFEVMGHGGD